MKWRHWSVLIVLLLLNYIIFSTALTQLARQRQPKPRPVRTLAPTFTATEPNPVAWIVLPTSTARPSPTPVTPRPTPTGPPSSTPQGTAAATEAPPTEVATDTPPPATPTPPDASLLHTVRRGESLSEIARGYGVSVQAIVEANDLDNPNRIVTGQKLIIPSPQQTPTPRPTATASP
jgi:LysM repeat protein